MRLLPVVLCSAGALCCGMWVVLEPLRWTVLNIACVCMMVFWTVPPRRVDGPRGNAVDAVWVVAICATVSLLGRYVDHVTQAGPPVAGTPEPNPIFVAILSMCFAGAYLHELSLCGPELYAKEAKRRRRVDKVLATLADPRPFVDPVVCSVCWDRPGLKWCSRPACSMPYCAPCVAACFVEITSDGHAVLKPCLNCVQPLQTRRTVNCVDPVNPAQPVEHRADSCA